jgi:hypothetical protein
MVPSITSSVPQHEPSVKRGNFEWAIDFREGTMHVMAQGHQTLLWAGCPATLPFLSYVQPLHRIATLL